MMFKLPFPIPAQPSPAPNAPPSALRPVLFLSLSLPLSDVGQRTSLTPASIDLFASLLLKPAKTIYLPYLLT